MRREMLKHINRLHTGGSSEVQQRLDDCFLIAKLCTSAVFMIVDRPPLLKHMKTLVNLKNGLPICSRRHGGRGHHPGTCRCFFLQCSNLCDERFGCKASFPNICFIVSNLCALWSWYLILCTIETSRALNKMSN